MVRRELFAVSAILIAALCARSAAADVLIGLAGPMTGKMPGSASNWSAARGRPWPT